MCLLFIPVGRFFNVNCAPFFDDCAVGDAMLSDDS